MDLITEPNQFSLNGNTYYKYLKVYYGNANRTFTKQRIPLGNCTDWSYPPRWRISMGTELTTLRWRKLRIARGMGRRRRTCWLEMARVHTSPSKWFTREIAQSCARRLVLRGDQNSKPDLLFFDFSSRSSKAFLMENTTIGSFPNAIRPMHMKELRCAPLPARWCPPRRCNSALAPRTKRLAEKLKSGLMARSAASNSSMPFRITASSMPVMPCRRGSTT